MVRSKRLRRTQGHRGAAKGAPGHAREAVPAFVAQQVESHAQAARVSDPKQRSRRSARLDGAGSCGRAAEATMGCETMPCNLCVPCQGFGDASQEAPDCV
jgi:hypothetical protein